MRIKFLLCVLLTAVTALSCGATATLLENFEGTVYGGSVTSGDTLTTAVIADHSEGAGSMQLTYAYAPGTPWTKNTSVKKQFAAPVDISALEYITLDMKVPVANANFMLCIAFHDQFGNQARVIDYGAFSTVATTWGTRTWKVSDLQKNRWMTSGRPIDMKNVTAISFHIQNGGDLTSAGTFVWQYDNFQMFSSVGILNEVVIDDFEIYSDNAALNAFWVKQFGATQNNPVLETANPYAGTKSLKIAENVTAQYTNYAASRVLTTPINFSGAMYFKVAVLGDTKLEGYTPTAHLYLEDVSGNRILAFMWDWPSKTGWHQMILPFQSDGIEGFTDSTFALAMGGASTWRQDRWDGGAWNVNCDLTQIKKVILSVETQGAGAGFPINGVQIAFDDLIAGFSSGEIPGPETPSVKSYVVNSTGGNAPAINGVVGATEWAMAGTPASGFVRHDSNTVAAGEDVQVKATYDSTYLYLLLQTTNANPALDFAPTGGMRDPSGTSFTGDDFEFFLAPGGNMASNYYHIVLFPNVNDNICYVWDEFNAGGAGSWNATGDLAAFSYNSTSKLMSIEYRVPWTAFNSAAAYVMGEPADAKKWGVQIGYINNSPAEAVNWEPDATAGFASGRPLGTFEFNLMPSASAADWNLFE